MKLNIAVFFGGESVEHEVSIITGHQAIAALDPEKYNVIPVYVAKAHYYFETLDTTAQLAAMDDDALYEYLCASPMNFYQIVPTRYVVTSPWFLNVYDSGYARQFVDAGLQESLLKAVQEKYPETASLTTLDFATFSATGLKTQQILSFEG
jgi:D-alanine-D-alanine ligase-like ATP-grasp enzyme